MFISDVNTCLISDTGHTSGCEQNYIFETKHALNKHNVFILLKCAINDNSKISISK